MEDFYKNYKYYDEDKGKSLKNVNIKEDLEKLATSMDSFTEEEALVQLLSKYRRKGFNTVLLLVFRNKYKNLLRWIRTPELIIDPQEYIDYEKKEVLPIIDRKLVDDIREASKESNGGKYPIRFYTLKEEETLTEDFDSTWSSVAANFVDNISKIQDVLLANKEPVTPLDMLGVISKDKVAFGSLEELCGYNHKLLLNKDSSLIIGFGKDTEAFSFANINWDDKNSGTLDTIITSELEKVKSGVYRGVADIYRNSKLLTDSELKHITAKIFLNITLFRNGIETFTPREITAIYLHEVGHLLALRESIALTAIKVSKDILVNLLAFLKGGLGNKENNIYFQKFKTELDKVLMARINKKAVLSYDMSADYISSKYGFEEDALSALKKTRRIIVKTPRNYITRSRAIVNLYILDPGISKRIIALKTRNFNLF